jgi:hypothetical protein
MGMFDDLIPQQAPAAAAAPSVNMFADLIPARTNGPQVPAGGLPLLKEAASNTPSSALQFIKNLVYPLMHPIDTAEGIKDIGLGALQKVRNMSPEHLRGTAAPFDETAVNAVGEHFAKRYGGAENVKQTFAKDPVGLAADASMLLTGGGTLAARGPSILGTAGRIANTAGRTIDPISIATLPLKVIEPAVSHAVGAMTGAGATPLREAYAAGRAGGPAAESFVDQMRGRAPVSDVVDAAKTAVANLREQRSSAYKKDMGGITVDATVLDFKPITDAVESVKSVGTYKGKDINPSASATWEKINGIVDDWSKSDPAQYHTVEGLDALKKAIGNIRDSTEFGSPSRKVADQAYQAVRAKIVEQAPAYGKVMKDYEAASATLSELERAFSLKDKSAIDTAVRKLQSIMRNNANTNYGQRAELGRTLEDAGAKNLMPLLAGQALSSATPRGLQSVGATVGGVGAAMTNPLFLMGLPLASPRIMGEAAYTLGKGFAGPTSTPTARAVNDALDPYLTRLLTYQAGQSGSLAHQPPRGLLN